jgi:hypothetical protein
MRTKVYTLGIVLLAGTSGCAVGVTEMADADPRQEPDDYLPIENPTPGLETGEETPVGAPTPSGYSGAGITGTRSGTYISDKGTQVANWDLSAITFDAVYKYNGTAWVGSRGTGAANGTFSVPNVPPGNYYLRWGKYFIWTDSRQVDLGVPLEGRPGFQAAAPGTQLTFDIGGLDPWQSGDDIHFYSMSTGAVRYYLDQVAEPAPGSNEFNATVAYGGRLVSAAQGDVSYVLQLVGTGNGTVTYRHLDEMCQLDFTITSGANNTFKCNVSDLTSDQNISVDWRRSDFESHRAQVSPIATLSLTRLFVQHQPGGTAHGYWNDAPILLRYFPTADVTDKDTGSMEYVDPFEGGAVVGRVYHYYNVGYVLPGATPLTIPAYIENQVTVQALDSGAVRPLVSPPTNPTINGVSAFTAQQGIGPTPTLSWGPPSRGTATAYWVFIYEIFNNAGKTDFTTAATLITKGTSLEVPSGILAPGKQYIFEFRAYHSPTIDHTRAPFRREFPRGRAEALSAIATY